MNPLFLPLPTRAATLPMEGSLFQAAADHAVISAVLPGADGKVLVRAYETAGEKGDVTLTFGADVAEARAVNLFGKEQETEVKVSGKSVTLAVEPYALAQVEVALAQ